MKIFRIIRGSLTKLGIESMPSTQFNGKFLSIFLSLVLGICLNALFLVNSAKTVMDYILGFCTISSLISIFLCFSAIAAQKEQLFEYIESVEELINKKLENPSSKAIYVETDQRVEKICGILKKVMGKLLPHSLIWPTFAMSFVKYIMTDLGNDAFQLPVPFWLPFNWKNPIGYFIAVPLQWIFFSYAFTALMTMVSINVAHYLYEMSLTKDIKGILHLIDENAKTEENRMKISAKIAEFIEFHSGARQTVSIISQVYQPIFMIFFPRTLLTLCCAMLFIQLEISRHGDYGAALLFLTLDAVDSFILLFISCEMGQRLSDAFEEINAIIDQYKWYLFPLELKRILPMIMIVAQKPVIMVLFGSISCGREVFAKSWKCAFSYFMVLREFIK